MTMLIPCVGGKQILLAQPDVFEALVSTVPWVRDSNNYFISHARSCTPNNFYHLSVDRTRICVQVIPMLTIATAFTAFVSRFKQ